jgi:hypothetical protein
MLPQAKNETNELSGSLWVTAGSIRLIDESN